MQEIDYQKRIQELETEIEKLQGLVINDELTGVLNRKGINEKLDIIFKEALYVKDHPDSKRSFHVDNLSIIYIDLDDFKKINDNYGHNIGDEVLKKLSFVVKEEIREIDVIGRMGGEEFVVALVGATEEDAYKKSERIRTAIKDNLKIEEFPNLNVTGSIGIASVKKTESKTISELITMADKAMYEAKKNRGKDNVVRYSELVES
jgi:diguanylate cyclase